MNANITVNDKNTHRRVSKLCIPMVFCSSLQSIRTLIVIHVSNQHVDVLLIQDQVLLQLHQELAFCRAILSQNLVANVWHLSLVLPVVKCDHSVLDQGAFGWNVRKESSNSDALVILHVISRILSLSISLPALTLLSTCNIVSPELPSAASNAK